MKYTVFFLFFLSFAPDIISQEEKKQLIEVSGIITNEEGYQVPFVHIIILNKGKGTIADHKGMFSFVAETNDTIIFRSVGYKQTGVTIPANLEDIHYPIEVRLVTDTIYLSVVEIYPWKNYEEFKEAFVNLELPESDMDRALKNFEIIKAQLFTDYIDLNAAPDPDLCYRNITAMQQYNASYKGMMTPSFNNWMSNPLLNYVAWANLIKMIKEGKFKRKNK